MIDPADGLENGPSSNSFPTQLVTICVQDSANSLNLFGRKTTIQEKFFVQKLDNVYLLKQAIVTLRGMAEQRFSKMRIFEVMKIRTSKHMYASCIFMQKYASKTTI